MRKALTVTVDAWGNIIVAGPLDEGGNEMFVAKLDKDGKLLWHRGLEGARASSLPPAAPDVAAAGDPRDSVEPHLLDDVLRLRPPRRRSTLKAVGAAFLVAFAVVGTSAAVQQTRTAGSQSALMQHDVLREVVIAGELGASPSDATSSPLPAASPSPLASDVPVLDASELRKETLALLSAGLPREALPFARTYVDAAPREAMSYLFLGATLQELGRANEAREVYNDCVKLADIGDASECYALGGRK